MGVVVLRRLYVLRILYVLYEAFTTGLCCTNCVVVVVDVCAVVDVSGSSLYVLRVLVFSSVGRNKKKMPLVRCFHQLLLVIPGFSY